MTEHAYTSYENELAEVNSRLAVFTAKPRFERKDIITVDIMNVYLDFKIETVTGYIRLCDLNEKELRDVKYWIEGRLNGQEKLQGSKKVE